MKITPQHPIVFCFNHGNLYKRRFCLVCLDIFICRFTAIYLDHLKSVFPRTNFKFLSQPDLLNRAKSADGNGKFCG